MLAMLLHRLVSTVYLNRAYIYCFADRAYIRYRTGITIVISVQKRRDVHSYICLLYTSPSPRDLSTSRMPSSA